MEDIEYKEGVDFKKGTELENKFIGAIKQTCVTARDIRETKLYFDGCHIPDLIDFALDE